MERFSKLATQLISMVRTTAYTPGAADDGTGPSIFVSLPMSALTRKRIRVRSRVFHAPNYGWAKGSQYLIEAIAKLHAEGVPIELDMVSGVPNEVVVSRMAECDIVVDQLLIGWHGYTALEAMARGKPVICYIRDRSELIDFDGCPIVSANPGDIEGVLRDLASRPRAALVELGRKSRDYAEQNYSVAAVARRLGHLYLDTADFPARARATINRQMEDSSMPEASFHGCFIDFCYLAIRPCAV